MISLEGRLALIRRKPDPAIARAVIAAIRSEMPAVGNATIGDLIRVHVSNGRVTLCGEVESESERAQAEALARKVRGVRDVDNGIIVRPPILPLDIKHRIENVLKLAAEVDADAIVVQAAERGTVILKGVVRSRAERDQAERTALEAPGVRAIDNQIEVVEGLRVKAEAADGRRL